MEFGYSGLIFRVYSYSSGSMFWVQGSGLRVDVFLACLSFRSHASGAHLNFRLVFAVSRSMFTGLVSWLGMKNLGLRALA